MFLCSFFLMSSVDDVRQNLADWPRERDRGPSSDWTHARPGFSSISNVFFFFFFLFYTLLPWPCLLGQTTYQNQITVRCICPTASIYYRCTKMGWLFFSIPIHCCIQHFNVTQMRRRAKTTVHLMKHFSILRKSYVSKMQQWLKLICHKYRL